MSGTPVANTPSTSANPNVNVPVTASSGGSGSSDAHPQSQQPGHTFLSTLPEIRNMENSLLSLLNSFHNGELSAFGQSKLETMNLIREKQERLARLHFDIGSSKQGEGSNWISETDQSKLVDGLRELSVEIEKLHNPEPPDPGLDLM